MIKLARNKVFSTATPANDIRFTLADYRTVAIDSFVVDKITGEMLGTYTIHDVIPTPYDYELPQAIKKKLAHSGYELDPAPHTKITEADTEVLPNGVVDLDAQRSKRGPKPKVFSNPHARHFKIAHDERLGWFDDYVYGACMTVAKDSNGIMNVSPAHVLRACMLDEISTEIIKAVIRLDGLRTMSDPQARRVCQCARFAIGGMEFYLERSPIVRQRLQFEVDFTDSYYEVNTGLLRGLA